MKKFLKNIWKHWAKAVFTCMAVLAWQPWFVRIIKKHSSIWNLEGINRSWCRTSDKKDGSDRERALLLTSQHSSLKPAKIISIYSQVTWELIFITGSTGKKRHQLHWASGENSSFGVDRALKSGRDMKCEIFCRNQICMTNELAYLSLLKNKQKLNII